MAIDLSPEELEEFKAEALELLESAEKCFLAVDLGDATSVHYDSIFRAFHSVKGAAAMLEREELQQLMHGLETDFANLKGSNSWPRASVDTFLRGIDRGRALVSGSNQLEQRETSQHIEAVTPDSTMSDHQDFLIECDERLSRIVKALSFARENGVLDQSQLNEIYRDVHTIKGAAGLFNLTSLESRSHKLETDLEEMRSQGQALDPLGIVKLVEEIDAIAGMIDIVRGGRSEVAPQSLATPGDHPSLKSKPQEIEPAGKHESSSIRINVSLLDRMMALMGELVLVRNQVIQFSNQSDDQSFINLSKRLNVVASDLQVEVMKTRMQPLGSILGKFQRTVRDLARELGKNIELELEGTETELDRTLLEAVKDPLMHLIRNSCDHGIESSEERLTAGKPDVGRVRVRAFHEGGQVVVEITDDGRGVDRERVIRKAIERAIIAPDQAQQLSDSEVIDLLFSPGFSTAAKVTSVSGRGVGMDVVKSNIEKIGGSVEIRSVQGKGSTVLLKIPLTLAIVPAMIVKNNGESYAIPQVKLRELVHTDQSASDRAIELFQGRPVLMLRGEILPLVFLNEALGIGVKPVPESASIVVVKSGKLRFGIIVDEIQDTADIVVKPLPNFLKSLSIYSGATVMGDGSVACILDVEGLATEVSLMPSAKEWSESQAFDEKTWGEVQEYIVFRLGDKKTRFAAILNLVNRIEEFDADTVERSGATSVVRYRGGLLPLFSMAELLGLEASHEPSEKLRVLVTQRRGHQIGLLVAEILDVFSTEEEPETHTVDRAGLMGNLVRGTELTVIVDLLELLDLALRKLRDEPEAQTRSAKKVRGGQGRRVLLVEDSPLFRKKIATALSSAGYDIETAQDGADALQKFERGLNQKQNWYAVVSDIEMPRMNGWELIKKLKTHSRIGSTKLIAVTSKDDTENKRKGRLAGFHHYLAKFDPQVLLEALDEQAAHEEAA